MNPDSKRKTVLKQPWTIRYKLVAYYSIFILALLAVIIAINFYIITKIQMENINNYGKAIVEQTKESIDSELKKFEIGSRIINNNALLQKLATQNFLYKGASSPISAQQKLDLSNAVMSITNVVGDVNSVGIFFGSETQYLFFGDTPRSKIDPDYIAFTEKTFKTLPQSDKPFIWAGPASFKGDKVVLLARNIISTNNFERLGRMVLHVNVDYLEQLLRKTKLGRANAVFITDAQGGLIGASNDAVYAQWADSNTYTAFSGQTVVRLDGEEFLVIKYTSGYTGWNIVGLLPLSTLQQQVLHNQTTLVLIGIAGLLISFLMTILITRQIARPIERLRSAMRAAETGALDVQYTDDTFLETHELGVGFVKMLHNIDELVVKIGKSELRKKDAELSALQAQINPHFLYNTLNTINYMLLLENKPEISRMVIYLGDLLRNSIETSREVITLEEDLAFVEKYLYIQKVRFEEKLQYRISVTEEARQCLILKLLVQPLVENAINHGVERQGGVVSITGEISDTGKLIVTVQDNGCGIPKEKLKDLLVDEKANDIKNQRTYIGVNNVNQRIKLFYGPEYGLAIQSGENAGTTVSIVVPAETGGRFADENNDCG